mmetsp:Transcript_29080/g.93777  ORF Transcript_29080/g.93777 Transcript_29080/m.93777 type:complete len:163 (-) Transcript_29080:49-537(-)
MAIDVNGRAAELTRRTARADGSRVDAIRGDLLTSMRDEAIDVVIFNPPYVTTPSDDVGGDTIEASWAGGRRGRVVIDRLLTADGLRRCLADGALLYLLLSDENEPAEVLAALASLGFEATTVLARTARTSYALLSFQTDAPSLPGNERLSVHRAVLKGGAPR